jgi:uncharacterized surface protein with fasciclin (FAS1) repeats
MKKIYAIVFLSSMSMMACTNHTSTSPAANVAAEAPVGGQENVKDDESQKDVVKVALGSKDHSTLVAALKQADLITSLSNAGPFTVFAPTNAAFGKLPNGTLEGLMKDDKKADLQNILQYHVTTSSLKPEYFRDSMNIGMVNGDNISIYIKDGKIIINGTATVVASIPASNGMIHVIDAVLLPPAKK